MPDSRRTSVVLMLAGVALAIAAAVGYAQVGSALHAQRMVVPEGACLAGETVAGPFTALCADRSGAFDLDASLTSFSLSAVAFLAGVALIMTGAAVLHHAERSVPPARA
jgi:hypothetical protein